MAVRTARGHKPAGAAALGGKALKIGMPLDATANNGRPREETRRTSEHVCNARARERASKVETRWRRGLNGGIPRDRKRTPFSGERVADTRSHGGGGGAAGEIFFEHLPRGLIAGGRVGEEHDEHTPPPPVRDVPPVWRGRGGDGGFSRGGESGPVTSFTAVLRLGTLRARNGRGN